VEVSADLAYAKVYVGSFDVTGPPEEANKAIEGLNAARGFLKRALGKRLRLRLMPELRFIEDTTERDAQHMREVINSAVAEDRRHGDPLADDDNAADDSEAHGPS
jgi:ribosome-binding factor A